MAVAMQSVRIRIFGFIFFARTAVTILPNRTAAHVKETRLFEKVWLIIPVSLKYETNQPFTQFSNPR